MILRPHTDVSKFFTSGAAKQALWRSTGGHQFVASTLKPARGDLRVHLLRESLQPQFAAYPGAPTRVRGYPPFAGQHALIIEVAPGLMIERVIDLALKTDPVLEPGILFVEPQFGILEIHGSDQARIQQTGQAVLAGLGLDAGDQLAARILYTDVIEDLADQHAVIINRNRQASMVLPGETLLIVEMVPALYAAIAANEAEKVAPGLTLVDVQMIGAAGRLYMAGSSAEVRQCLAEVARVLAAIKGRAG